MNEDFEKILSSFEVIKSWYWYRYQEHIEIDWELFEYQINGLQLEIFKINRNRLDKNGFYMREMKECYYVDFE